MSDSATASNASRFQNSTLNHRTADPRSALFENYKGGSSSRGSPSPARPSYAASRFSNPSPQNYAQGGSQEFRSATPNSRGQYSDAVLSELESQNDEGISEMSRKVRMLKDITLAIGDEIRDSTKLTERMNDGFENTRIRLRGTMNRMLIMAEKTGVGWKVWILFFLAVCLLFWYVRLF
jgi:blocked-early-in-transport protein 1